MRVTNCSVIPPIRKFQPPVDIDSLLLARMRHFLVFLNYYHCLVHLEPLELSIF